MLVTCRQMQEAEEALFSRGVSAEPFMDEAGRQCADAISDFFPKSGYATIFCGKGNNGGDALVVGRILKERGWKVELHFTDGRENRSPLAQKKLSEFDETASAEREPATRHHILVDGLLGIGATGDLRGSVRDAADLLNRLRESQFATCFAIDIPTGLDADTGVPYEGAVIADVTLSITAAKIGFASEASLNHVGRLVEIPLSIPIPQTEEVETTKQFLFPSNLRPRLKRRLFGSHKGDSGRVIILAGSPGLTGAAILTALGASRSGAGLITLLVPEEAYPVIAATAPVEVMVQSISDYDEISTMRADALAIGPGLGTVHGHKKTGQLLDLMTSLPAPMVIDADGLNLLSENKESLENLPSNRILTPHPGELARLSDESGDRNSLTRKLADEWGLTLLHKGSRTTIASPGQKLEINSTGTPGMASGGMGDVLTGVCASLIAQGMTPHDAACIGSWLLGRAAEIAIRESRVAPESISAVAVAEHIGMAMLELQMAGGV